MCRTCQPAHDFRRMCIKPFSHLPYLMKGQHSSPHGFSIDLLKISHLKTILHPAYSFTLVEQAPGSVDGGLIRQGLFDCFLEIIMVNQGFI